MNCPLCTKTKVQMLDVILKKCGYKMGKSKYSDGQITKIEVYHIYKHIMKRRRY